MIKTLLIVLVSLCCVIVGVKMRAYYKRRAKLWEELYRFAVYFKEEISFNKTVVEEIIENFNESDDFRTLRSGNFDGLPFDEEEIRFITDFFNSLGRFNLVLEVENVERRVEKIKEKCSVSEKLSDDRGKTAVKLSVLVAIGVFVVLV